MRWLPGRRSTTRAGRWGNTLAKGLRGSRNEKGRQSPGTGILAYQRPVIWEYFKNNFIAADTTELRRSGCPFLFSCFRLYRFVFSHLLCLPIGKTFQLSAYELLLRILDSPYQYTGHSVTDEAGGFNRDRFTKHEIDSSSRISLKAVVLNSKGREHFFRAIEGNLQRKTRCKWVIYTSIAGRCLNTRLKIVGEFGKSISDATDLIVIGIFDNAYYAKQNRVGLKVVLSLKRRLVCSCLLDATGDYKGFSWFSCVNRQLKRYILKWN